MWIVGRAQQGGQQLDGDSQTLERILLASAPTLANADSLDGVLHTLCDKLVAASSRIKIAQVYIYENGAVFPRIRQVRTVTEENAQRLSDAEIAILEEGLTPLLTATVTANSPRLFKPQHEPRLVQLGGRFSHAGIEAAVALPFASPNPNEKMLVVLFVDDPDYFQSVGLEPFVAYTCLSGIILNQIRQKQQLSDFATFDHLTGLLNRRTLIEILEREHVRAERYSRRYSLLFFDIDHFTAINDNYGRAVGDQVLQAVARIAAKILREGDWIGRWGGEEFLCILPDTSEIEAERIAQRLRVEVIDRPLSVAGKPVPYTLSIGVACYPQDGRDINSLLVHADNGLLTAKQQGRNCVVRQPRSLLE